MRRKLPPRFVFRRKTAWGYKRCHGFCPCNFYKMGKYIEKSVSEYLADLAAKKPAPGGGSAAALLGALGSALTSMVCNYTVGKEKFKSVEAEMREILRASEDLRAAFQELVDRDITCYSRVSQAYKLPKGPDRDSTVKDALLKSLDVSIEIGRKSLAGVKLCPALAEKANPYLISDVGCAAWGFLAAFKCAMINVDINLSTLKDEELTARTKEEFIPLEKEIGRINTEVNSVVNQSLNR